MNRFSFALAILFVLPACQGNDCKEESDRRAKTSEQRDTEVAESERESEERSEKDRSRSARDRAVSESEGEASNATAKTKANDDPSEGPVKVSKKGASVDKTKVDKRGATAPGGVRVSKDGLKIPGLNF